MMKYLTDDERKRRRREQDKRNHRKYRKANPEKHKAANKLYAQTHKDVLHRARDRYRESHPEWKLFHMAKNRAKRLNMEFSIELDDIIIPECCPFLGIKLTNFAGRGRVDSNISLDRIDSSKGYTKGNIQVVSEMANRMKNNATEEQLITFSKRVINLYYGKYL